MTSQEMGLIQRHFLLRTAAWGLPRECCGKPQFSAVGRRDGNFLTHAKEE